MQPSTYDAFNTALYCVMLEGDRQVLTVGSPCPAPLAAWLRDHAGAVPAWLITAANPGAQALTAERNRARASVLRDWAQSHAPAWLKAVNEDPAGYWPDEPGLLLAGIEEGQARAIARRFGQLAILRVSAQTPAELVWLETPAT